MANSREPIVRPPGDPKTLWRSTLQTGAELLQSRAPLKNFDIYVVGLLCAKAHPQRGVNDLKGCFPNANGRPDGVRGSDE